MASNSISNFRIDTWMDSKVRKRKIEQENPDHSSITNNTQINRWRSVSEERTYLSKIVEALRTVRVRSTTRTSTAANSSSKTRAVREAADRILAVAAKGRTRWSRAILTNRIRIGLRNRKKATVRSRATGGVLRSVRQSPSSHSQVRDLGRLIPGCRKLPLPNLLEETTDYIAALEMQVRAMASLVFLITGNTASPAGES